MTCIVGLVDNGKVYMGADSAGTNGWLHQTIRLDAKMFKVEDFLIGGCGSFRMLQLLHYKLRPPKRYPDADIMKFMVADFVESVRTCLREGGFTHIKENNEEIDGSFLVGYQGRLFEIECDLQVGESVDGYNGIGSGGMIALGSLYTSQGTPEERIRKALETAEHFNAGVRGPFHIECLEAKV